MDLLDINFRFYVQELQEQEEEEKQKQQEEDQEQQQNWDHVLVPGEVFVIAQASKGTFVVRSWSCLPYFILLPVYHACQM